MPNIHHAILIGSPAGKVYSAITSEEGLSKWWTPYTTAQPVLDSIARFPFGSGYFKEMKIIQLKPLELVKWECITGDDEWVGTTLSFQLYPVDKKTMLDTHPEMLGQVEQQENFEKGSLLVFHHNDWKDYTPMFAECSFTWSQFLRSLKLLCETGKGRPWPNQHLMK